MSSKQNGGQTFPIPSFLLGKSRRKSAVFFFPLLPELKYHPIVTHLSPSSRSCNEEGEEIKKEKKKKNIYTRKHLALK